MGREERPLRPLIGRAASPSSRGVLPTCRTTLKVATSDPYSTRARSAARLQMGIGSFVPGELEAGPVNQIRFLIFAWEMVNTHLFFFRPPAQPGEFPAMVPPVVPGSFEQTGP